MESSIYWLKGLPAGRLGITPRPRGGDWLEHEVAGWKRAGIDTVLSLLTADENSEFDLANEPAECERAGIRYLALPIPDRGVPPSRQALEAAVSGVQSDLRAGKNVVVHCRQGIGRSALVVAAVLVASGLSGDQALSRVASARGVPVPETAAQRDWVKQFAEAHVPRAQQPLAADAARRRG